MSSWQDTLSGAGSGATIGAGIGSIIPGLGTGIGAGVGGLLGGLGSFFGKGKEAQYGQQPAMSPEQIQMLQQFFGGGTGQMGADVLQQQLGGQAPAQEQQLISQYQQEFLPQLAEQYGGGGYGSGAFAQQGAQGAERLTGSLSALREQTQQQGLQNLMHLLQMQTMFPTYTPGTPGFAQQIAPLAGQLGGAWLGRK